MSSGGTLKEAFRCPAPRLPAAEMPVDALAEVLQEHDTRLWRVVRHYVEQAHAKSDWSAVRRTAVDETSARRDHRYVTNVLDAETSRLLFRVEGRSAQALEAFAQALRAHGGELAQIEAIALDMSPAYVKGATAPFPQATLVFDKFHLLMLAGQALEEVRRGLQGQGAALKGALWSFPRLLQRIPVELRDERMIRLCVPVASGLFDPAVIYVWNAAIVELREKVRRFGINIVPQILDDKSFTEETLLDLKDAELLDLCRKLNLISNEDFFFLDQCRATRNSFAVAHPAESVVDEDEFITFLSRCQKHALSSVHHPRGVDTKALLASLKASRFNKDQSEEWKRRVDNTFDAQRELIFVMLHGI
jgi:hypothetical protein